MNTEIEKIIGHALACNRAGQPVNLWLIAPPNHGKTTICERFFAGNPRMMKSSSYITANEFRTKIFPALRGNSIHTIIQDDVGMLSYKHRDDILSYFTQIGNGKISITQHNTDFEAEVKCGMILTCTDFFYATIEKKIITSGLDTRFIPIFFKLSADSLRRISEHCLNGNEPLPSLKIPDVQFRELETSEKQQLRELFSATRQQLMAARMIRSGCPEILEYIRKPLREVEIYGI